MPKDPAGGSPLTALLSSKARAAYTLGADPTTDAASSDPGSVSTANAATAKARSLGLSPLQARLALLASGTTRVQPTPTVTRDPVAPPPPTPLVAIAPVAAANNQTTYLVGGGLALVAAFLLLSGGKVR